MGPGPSARPWGEGAPSQHTPDSPVLKTNKTGLGGTPWVVSPPGEGMNEVY